MIRQLTIIFEKKAERSMSYRYHINGTTYTNTKRCLQYNSKQVNGNSVNIAQTLDAVLEAVFGRLQWKLMPGQPS